ncbi:18383_t:CDS:2 [Racocetra fulgida]|uniref:18383_t:CDS:1 n=1 Tax=Racocetra fulgida TaxID=60492 RepID=A0A9N9G3H7_9GLOM|nr:18383_t:CDS:2 [Racocetra fulgida]
MKKLFEEAEALNEATNFIYEIEIEDDLLTAFSLMPLELNNNEDLKIIKTNFQKYALYKKKFDTALELYKQEMDNDNFVNNFGAMMASLLKEIEEYEKVLKAHKQQAT